MNKNQRTILHIQAGNAQWIPTKAELDDLTELFTRALKEGEQGRVAVLATRSSIEVTSHFIDGDAIVAVNSKPAPSDNA
jgi:hypothetical protein